MLLAACTEYDGNSGEGQEGGGPELGEGEYMCRPRQRYQNYLG